MKRFKKSAFILAALLVVQSIGIAPLRMTTKAAENGTNAIIEEDFSDYFGGAPEGVSNTGIKALSGQYSDFQGNSLRWQNPEDGSAQIANQLVDGITYTLDKPLENGKYVLSFECLFENTSTRLFMCCIDGGGKSGRSFVCQSGQMGYNKSMGGWAPTNAARFAYEANKWYHIDMVFDLSATDGKIHYYIDGKPYGSGDALTETGVHPIEKISFRIEDRKASGSMYLDNIRLTEGTDGRKLRIHSDVFEGDSTVDIRLPASVKDGSVIAKEDISLVAPSGKTVGISSLTKLTSEIYRIKTAEELAHGAYTVNINSDAQDFLDRKSLNKISAGFIIHQRVTDIKSTFGLSDTCTLLNGEISNDSGVTAALKKNITAEPHQKQGIYGWRLINKNENCDLYLDVTDSKFSGISDGSNVRVRVVYFDSGYGSLSLYYNSVYKAREFGGRIELTGTNEWKTHDFVLNLPQFQNKITENGKGYDLVLSTYSYDRGYSKNSVTVAAVSAEKVTNELPVKITADSGKIGNIFFTGDELAFDLKLADLAQTKAVYTREVSVASESGETVWNSGEGIADLEDTPLYKEKITVPKLKYGIYTLTVAVCRNGEKSQKSYEFSYVNSRHGEVLNDNLGICMHYSLGDYKNWNGSSETLLDLYSNAGIGYVRDNVNIDDYAKRNVDGTYTRKVPDVLSGYITEITKRKMKFMPILEGGGKYFDNESPLYTENAQKTFAENAAYYASELKAAGIDCFELWNEYNSAAYNIPPRSNLTNDDYYKKAQYYVNFLDYVYTAVKDKCPDFKIVGGATANVPVNWLKKVFEGIAAKGKGGLMDVLSVHPYIADPTADALVTRAQSVESAAAKYGLSKYPLWATEFGWTTSGAEGVSPKRQAQIITSYYLAANSHNAFDKMFIYSYKDNNAASDGKEMQFGIIKANKSDVLDVPCAAKPAYLAVSNMNVQLGGAVPTKVIYDEDNKNLCEYTAQNGDKIYTAWGSGSIEYDFKSPRVLVTDIYGNESTLDSESGVYGIALSADVLYIKVPKYALPVYTVNRSSKTARIYFGAESGVSEENRPQIITDGGKSVDYELKNEGNTYFADVASDKDYIVMWTEDGFVNRLYVTASSGGAQFANPSSSYTVGVSSADGRVKVSGVSEYKNTELCAAAFFPSQTQSIASGGEPLPWYGGTATDGCGRYFASFKTDITPGTYSLSLSANGKNAVSIDFELRQDIELSLRQEGRYIRDIKDVDTSKPVSVSAYFKESDKYKDAVLIFVVKSDKRLKYVKINTVKECENTGGEYMFTVDGSVLKDGSGARVFLWKDLESLTPLK